MITITQKTTGAPAPQQPEYRVGFAPEFELWIVFENDKSIAYCPEQAYALAVACALRFLRSEVFQRAGAMLNLVRPVTHQLNN